MIPVKSDVISIPGTPEVHEVTGDLDGNPIFLGRMCANSKHGGLDVSDDPGWWPGVARPETWRPSRVRAILWMEERKGL